MTIQRTALIALLTVAGLAACGSDSSGGASPVSNANTEVSVAVTGGDAPAGAGNSITIKDFTFTATEATAGATVDIANNDTAAHTVTADDGSFDVKVDAGATATITAPSAPGSYSFLCSIHISMKGVLVVTG